MCHSNGAAEPNLKQTSSQLQNLIHILFTPAAGSGCGGLEWYYTTRVGLSPLSVFILV